MTKDRFIEIKYIIEEIDELEEFIPFFKEWKFGNGLRTKSVRPDRDIYFRVRQNSKVNEKIVSVLEERLKELKDLLDKA